MTAEPNWVSDPNWRSADRAERAVVGSYELVAFDVPADGDKPRMIGWEISTGPELQTQVATGRSDSFDEAKLAAEVALHSITEGPLII